MADRSEMRVLLNATSRELRILGGDLTYYRDLQNLSRRSAIEFVTMDSSALRTAASAARRIANRMYQPEMPTRFRMGLYSSSRLTLVSQRSSISFVPDLLLSHILFPAYPPWVRKRLPVVWSTQGISPAEYYDHPGTGGYIRSDVISMYGVFARKCAALIIWTEACALPFRQAFPELAHRVHVIHPPVLPSSHVTIKPSLADGVVRILFVGLDAQRKGLIDVLRALVALPDEVPIQLTVVTRPESFTEMSNFQDVRIRWLRSDPSLDVRRLMDESDLFVLPTYADTYGLAAVEAMSRKCATIISDLSPLPEVAPDGKVGFVVPRGSPEVLTEKMLVLIRNPSLLRQYQESAYKLFLKRNHPDVVLARMLQLFQEVLNEPKSGQLKVATQ